MAGRIDLNLLQILEALLRERSVSAAASRLGLGQPATSAALARLRVLLDDPLLIRTGRGMEPTSRALAMEEGLRAALADLRALVAPEAAFDPASTRRTFRISGGDYAAMVLLPPLLRRLEADAPGIDLRFRFIEKGRVLACLDDDDIDFALGVLGAVPGRFRAERLLKDSLICVVRAGHPLEGSALTAALFAGQRHVLVTERGDETGAVDAALEAQGLTRRIVLTVPLVSLVPMLLAGSDAVATIARCAALCLARTAPIRLLPLPLAIPYWQLDTVVAVRRARDPGLVWLRGVLAEIADAVEQAATS